MFSNRQAGWVSLGFGNDVQHDLINVVETGARIEDHDMKTLFGPIFTPTPCFAFSENVVMNNGSLTFTEVSNVTFTATVRGMPVTIHLKPSSYPNAVNLGSNGVLPMPILSSPDFDATTVDESTVELAGASVAIRGRNNYLASQEDANGDGLLDLVCHVEVTNLDPGAVQEGFVRLCGQTFDGRAIEGWDEITIVPQD
jgi:hypothetical protein